MAMNSTNLASEIVTQLEAQGFVSGTFSKYDEMATALAIAIVNHIQTNAEIGSSGAHAEAGDGNHTHPAGNIS